MYSLKINKDCLPKSLKLETDKDGFIYGNLFVGKTGINVDFMNETETLLSCNTFRLIESTHLLMRFYALVKIKTFEYEPCVLTFWFNYSPKQ